jgi:hypothetical protein
MRNAVTTPPTNGSRRRTTNSIGLWGAPVCGKTTFLAALYVAVSRASDELNIFGVDDTSTDFLIKANEMMTSKHMFPEATYAVHSYSWVMNMLARPHMADRGRAGRFAEAPAAVPIQFNIDMRDAPGEMFKSDYSLPQESRLDLGDGAPDAGPDQDDMMEYLAGCQGLLLLIDPLRERGRGNGHEYFQGTLLKMAQHRMARMPPGSKLPHHIAVCITKFDEPEVYKFARLNGFRSYDDNDPYLFPRVHEDDAETFFRELCSTEKSDADLICNGLRKYFYQDRIRYFVTSAIGFYRSGGRFREDDYQNAVEQNGTFTIRGQVHPINVLEPILWLGQSITEGKP